MMFLWQDFGLVIPIFLHFCEVVAQIIYYWNSLLLVEFPVDSVKYLFGWGLSHILVQSKRPISISDSLSFSLSMKIKAI